MSLLSGLSRVMASLGSSLGVELAMDLGTANTLIYLKGQGIVLNEPSVVAIDTSTNRTVAIGKQAAEYLGRTPAWITATRPLKDGVIADFDAAMAMIRGFLVRVFRPRLWNNPTLVVGVPSGITQVEKRAVKDSAHEAGARRIFLVEEPMAAALGAGLDVERPRGNMVVDIGGGTTEVAVISLCATVYCESIRVAGDEMDEAIVRFMQRKMRLEITPFMAERVKMRIGCATSADRRDTMEVTAKQIGRGGARRVTLNSSHVSQALEEPVDAIIDAVRGALEQTPPPMLADIQERGIVLTGGGALLPGLDHLLGTMTGIPAHVVDDPLTSVVRGCGMALEQPNRWKRIFIA